MSLDLRLPLYYEHNTNAIAKFTAPMLHYDVLRTS